MAELFALNPEYSTTRLVTREKPMIEEPPDAAFETVLFLPEGEGRKGEGGLRTQGYFKRSLPDKPLITVITVVFNGAEHLEQTILSVIGQTYDNVEYIVIDGGSTDGTLDIVHKYEHAIDYWVSESDEGIYDAMNKGVDILLGDWICFFGVGDFLWNDEVLKKITRRLGLIDLDIRVVYCRTMFLNKKGEKLYLLGEPWVKIKKRFKSAMSLCHQSVLHRKALFKKHGKFDSSFRIAGDYELLLRELKNGEAVFFSDIIFSGMVQGGVSSTPSNSLTILFENRQAQRKNGEGKIRWLWLLALARVYIRLILLSFLTERKTRKILDFGRHIMGLSPHWMKTLN